MSAESIPVEEPKKSKKPSCRWTSESKGILIDVMLERVADGVHTDSGFKSRDWKIMLLAFNDRNSSNFDRQQLQSQCNELKKAYGIVSKLRDNSGFGFDNEKILPTAPDDTWDRYLIAHPEAAKWRTTPLLRYDDLETIFSGKCATGVWSFSSNQVMEDTAPCSGSEPTSSTGSKSGKDVTENDFDVSIDKLSSPNFTSPTKSSKRTSKRKNSERDDLVNVLHTLYGKKRTTTQMACEAFDESFGDKYDEATSFQIKEDFCIGKKAELFVSLSYKEKEFYLNKYYSA